MKTATAQTAKKVRKQKVYSYTRFSHALQRKGRSKKRQDAGAVQWCAKHGHTLEPANIFFDPARSAFKDRNNAEHGELKTFLRLVDDGHVQRGDILIVENLDRLSRRNVNIAQELLLSIINRGIIVITLIDNAEYRDDAPAAVLFAQMMMSLAIFMRANDESRTKSQRKKDSWKAKREGAMKGEYHGGQLPRWIEVVNGKYRLIPAEAKLMQNIVDDYCDGYGRYRLSQKYQIAGGTIDYWLTNPILIGTLTVEENGAKVQIANHYPAVIERKKWDHLQKLKSERYIARRAGRIGAIPNLFTGLLRDPNGKPMIVQQHNGGTRNYVSIGCVIRCRWLEEVVCSWAMLDRFVTVREVEEVEAVDEKKRAKIESDLKAIQAMIREEPESAVTFIPAVRKLEQQRRSLIQPKIVREVVDGALIKRLLDVKADRDERLKLREIAQQSIQQIKLTKVEGGNWYQMIHGIVTLTDGEQRPFRYAYGTRRDGWVNCLPKGDVSDHHDRDDLVWPVVADTITDEVKAELAKLPLKNGG